jgi:hypothetical protein
MKESKENIGFFEKLRNFDGRDRAPFTCYLELVMPGKSWLLWKIPYSKVQ